MGHTGFSRRISAPAIASLDIDDTTGRLLNMTWRTDKRRPVTGITSGRHGHESCTPYADICITVRDKTLDQTKYEESDFEPSSCIEAVGVASKRKCMVGLQASLALTLPILSLFT